MNKKGFTLVELLVTITIMLLITIIAVPTTMRFVKNGKQKQYDILHSQIVSAASKYHIKHKDETCIEFEKLINEIDDKYIKEGKVIDPRNNSNLKGMIEVVIEGDKVTYKLITESTATCQLSHSIQNEYPTLAARNAWFQGSTEEKKQLLKST